MAELKNSAKDRLILCHTENNVLKLLNKGLCQIMFDWRER